jgi:DNA mismatch repair ATPase MutS
MLSETYDLYHFSEVISDTTIDFDYKLKEGKLKNRNEIRILEINNYPTEIIDEALAISKQLDNSN